MTHPTLERLCVHESVENVIPKVAFVEAFDDLSIPAELVGDDETFTQTDAIASFHPRDAYLDAAWTHCIRAGYDAFDTDAYEAAGVPLTNSTGISTSIAIIRTRPTGTPRRTSGRSLLRTNGSASSASAHSGRVSRPALTHSGWRSSASAGRTSR